MTTRHTPGPCKCYVHVDKDPSRSRIVHCPLHEAAPRMLELIASMNHMGGDESGGYCICPRQDGSAPDDEHSTGCADARALLREVEGA